MIEVLIESLLRTAMDSKFGIRVSSSAPEILRRRCYVIRQAMVQRGITEAKDLTFTYNPRNPNESLYIVKRSALRFDPRPASMRGRPEARVDEG